MTLPRIRPHTRTGHQIAARRPSPTGGPFVQCRPRMSVPPPNRECGFRRGCVDRRQQRELDYGLEAEAERRATQHRRKCEPGVEVERRPAKSYAQAGGMPLQRRPIQPRRQPVLGRGPSRSAQSQAARGPRPPTPAGLRSTRGVVEMATAPSATR